MLSRLIQTLTDAGKATEVFSSPDGSTALILPYGARVLGLFAPQSEQNFFWTHPALDAVESAKAFYESNQWHNSGGDRTWIGPELDFFLPNYPDISFSGYTVPRQLDAGNFQLLREAGHVLLVNRLSLTASRSKATVELEVTKALGPACNPLRYEPGWKDMASVEYAGYTLHTTLRWLGSSGDGPLQAGLWNLLQLPHRGEQLVSTYRRASAKRYFGAPDPEDLSISEHLIRYRMHAPDVHKLGFRAVDMTGRVGYMYPAGDQTALVIRNFAVNPSGEYVDVPWTEPANRGFAGQACNVNDALGSFSELEYHVPAIGKGTGSERSDDVSQVWAYRGPQASVRAIAKSLLSAEA